EAAIAHLRVLLGGLDNFDDTLRWAATQECLARSHAGLFALTDDTAHLQEAASCCRTALEDLRKSHDAALWGRLQAGLGGAALGLAALPDADIALCEEAVDALRAALTVTERARDPQHWARL